MEKTDLNIRLKATDFHASVRQARTPVGSPEPEVLTGKPVLPRRRSSTRPRPEVNESDVEFLHTGMLCTVMLTYNETCYDYTAAIQHNNDFFLPLQMVIERARQRQKSLSVLQRCMRQERKGQVKKGDKLQVNLTNIKLKFVS